MSFFQYKTIKSPVRVKIPVGACRFIASVAPVKNEEEAKSFIEKLSAEFNDATHNAFAYKIGLGDRAIARNSDAAEPAGTAGPPLQESIENNNLTNLVVVGTRYFGGVKLGIGGLVRAYRQCGEAGIKAAQVVVCYFTVKLQVIIDYDYIGDVMNELDKIGGSLLDMSYSQKVSITYQVKEKDAPELKEKILTSTRGQAQFTQFEEAQ